MEKKNIYVTRPSLPPLEELQPYLEKIWESRVLTNGGPFHQQLEQQLCEYLGVKYISLFNNATIALITALQVVDAIEQITKKHSLKVLYDAAHAFGVKCHCGSVLNHGDLSVLSFHATKVFNTFEGGAIISHDPDTKREIDQLKNFGFVDETTVVAAGLNGKMSELNAAVGLLQLKYVAQYLEQRSKIDGLYRELLSGVNGIRILGGATIATANFSYFPILVEPTGPRTRDAVFNRLRMNGVFARRYFYPLISDFPMYANLPTSKRQSLPVASQAASQVLCLPIYPGLSSQEVVDICSVVKTG